MRERQPAPEPVTTPPGAVTTFGSRLRAVCEPRHRAEAARAATAMLLLSAAVTGLFAIVEPSAGKPLVRLYARERIIGLRICGGVMRVDDQRLAAVFGH